MRFQGSESVPPHLDRRQQWRMLGFVFLIGLALVGIVAWQNGFGKRSESPKQELASPDEMDFGVAPDSESPLDPDEFRIPAKRKRGFRSADEAVEENSAGERSEIAIDPEWLTGIKDNTLGIRQDEAAAYYRLLAKARTIPWKEFRAAAEEAMYVNLMSSPEKYRGIPVTIAGELVRLYAFDAPPGESALSTLYEAWILTADSGNHPFRVVASEIPQELKPGGDIHRAVRVTGYFFKREGYEASKGRLHVAPTLLAGRIVLDGSGPTQPGLTATSPWIWGIATAAGLAFLATIVGLAIGDGRTRRRQAREALPVFDAESLSAEAPRPSVAESLRRLEEELPREDAAATLSPTENGYASSVGPIVELPTPTPPTRAPRRRDASE